MSGKQRKRQIKDKRQAQRAIAEKTIPGNSVAADLSKQVPINSYDTPPLVYVDKVFNCKDCGTTETWTARQQKWYYEVAKGSLHATAVRCHSCRKKKAETQKGKGDPNPIKHEGTLIKYVQKAITPAIESAGLEFIRKYHLPIIGSIALDYSRSDIDLTCWYDREQVCLVAEALDQSADYTCVSRVSLNQMRTNDLMLEGIAMFSSAVTLYLEGLPSVERAD